ncbi:MAG: hypothetical protein ACPGLV_02525 [Bacteroidia bacterium]
MKHFLSFILLTIAVATLSACNNIGRNEPNFHNSNYRVGDWVNDQLSDTLHFIDDTEMIRKWGSSFNEVYKYRIENDILFIKLPDGEYETKHSILELESNTAKLANMYFTNGFQDNSGVFTKKE